MTIDLEEITGHLPQDELALVVHQMLNRVWDLETTQRPQTVQEIINRLDEVTTEPARQAVMRQRGRQCFSSFALEYAREQVGEAADVDDLLARLNRADIGGGNLVREGNVITGSYASCPCGVVNATQAPISATYCQCSCGWYEELFEAFLSEPVKVELLDSITHGAETCRFVIRI